MITQPARSPPPQSSPTAFPEGSHEQHTYAKKRAFSAIWSVLENSDTNDQLQTPALVAGERQIKALVRLSGSLLSMLARFGDDIVCKQSIFDLTEFVLDVMDASANKEGAEDLANFVFDYIQGSTSIPNTPIVEAAATLITPEEDVEDVAGSGSEEEQGCAAIHLVSSANIQVSQYKYNPPILDYEYTPIAKFGARLLSDRFGCDVCPRTVINYTPTLSEYIADTIATARIERSIAIYALALLARLSTWARVSVPHGTFGLFITAYMIAGKMLSDSTYNNSSWCIVGQNMFTLGEINEMERKMCGDLKWKLDVSDKELEGFEAKIFEGYSGKIDYFGSRLPTPIPESGTSPLLSSLLSVPSKFQVHSGDFTPIPQITTSSESFVHAEIDSSPKWGPPSPSTLGWPSSDQAVPKGQNNNRELIWVEYHESDYENEVTRIWKKMKTSFSECGVPTLPDPSLALQKALELQQLLEEFLLVLELNPKIAGVLEYSPLGSLELSRVSNLSPGPWYSPMTLTLPGPTSSTLALTSRTSQYQGTPECKYLSCTITYRRLSDAQYHNYQPSKVTQPFKPDICVPPPRYLKSKGRQKFEIVHASSSL
ncbi:hypothetical protein OPQ81_006024 [Rhizoctonia solani]|nr:hypothetical protein OPQ81_006024 [Rhizoctonia solani]